MARHPSRRSAIVADRRPLERGLARFLLEERGLFVVGEAATMADVLLQVQQLRPDIVVLHEKLALDHDPTVLAQIRRISSRTSIVLLAASRAALPAELILLVDTVVEDGPGLTELGAAVAGPSPAKDASVDAVAVVAASAVAPAGARSGRSMGRPGPGVAVASIIALAFVVARNVTTPSPTVEASAHLQAAWHSLDELESALPTATTAQIAEIASALIDERAAAEAAGVDLAPFDEELRARLVLLWSSLPLATQALLVALFGEIIDDSDVAPLPSPRPRPSLHRAPSLHPIRARSRRRPPHPPRTAAARATDHDRRRPRPRRRRRPRPRRRPPTETTTPPPTETTTPPPTEPPTTTAADRDHDAAADRDHDAAADRDHDAAADRDHDAAADRDHDAAADRDHDAASPGRRNAERVARVRTVLADPLARASPGGRDDARARRPRRD